MAVFIDARLVDIVQVDIVQSCHLPLTFGTGVQNILLAGIHILFTVTARRVFVHIFPFGILAGIGRILLDDKNRATFVRRHALGQFLLLFYDALFLDAADSGHY